MWLLVSMLGAYCLVCLLAFVFQRSLLYLPVHWSRGEAEHAGEGFEQAWIDTSDGERLHAWVQPVQSSPWTVVIFHGNAGNLSYHQATLLPFRRLGIQAVLFDYRGYGLSSGRPSQQGLLKDGEAVAEYVETRLGVPRSRIVYFGQSLGSGVAALLAAQRPPARLILESAYPSMAQVAAYHYRFLPVGWLMLDRFDVTAAFRNISCPVLFLHPELDEIIPIAFGRALFAAAREPKRFVVLPRAHHNDAYELALDEHVQAVREFLLEDSDTPSEHD